MLIKNILNKVLYWINANLGSLDVGSNKSKFINNIIYKNLTVKVYINFCELRVLVYKFK